MKTINTAFINRVGPFLSGVGPFVGPFIGDGPFVGLFSQRIGRGGVSVVDE